MIDNNALVYNFFFQIGLTLAPCETGDVGVYKCVLKNPIGEIESEAKIHVKKIFHSPVFIQPLHDLDQVLIYFSHEN